MLFDIAAPQILWMFIQYKTFKAFSWIILLQNAEDSGYLARATQAEHSETSSEETYVQSISQDYMISGMLPGYYLSVTESVYCSTPISDRGSMKGCQSAAPKALL